jgi:biofilm PGA synthesis protein PgaD
MKLVRTRQSTVMWLIDVLLTLLAWAGLIWLLARGIGRCSTPAAARASSADFRGAQYPADLPVGRAVQRRDPDQLGPLPATRGRQFARRRAEAKALSDKNLSESFSLTKASWSNCAGRGAGDPQRRRRARLGSKAHISRDVEKPGLTLVPGQDRNKDAS